MPPEKGLCFGKIGLIVGNGWMKIISLMNPEIISRCMTVFLWRQAGVPFKIFAKE